MNYREVLKPVQGVLTEFLEFGAWPVRTMLEAAIATEKNPALRDSSLMNPVGTVVKAYGKIPEFVNEIDQAGLDAINRVRVLADRCVLRP